MEMLPPLWAKGVVVRNKFHLQRLAVLQYTVVSDSNGSAIVVARDAVGAAAED